MIIFDEDFIKYLLESLPVSYITMAHDDYQYEKRKQDFKYKVIDKITRADINKLELSLDTFKFNEIIGGNNK